MKYSTISIKDDSGHILSFSSPPKRIISLVPSLTHSLVEMGFANRIVGRTSFCTEPKEVVEDIADIGGPKEPNTRKIISLKPDLLIADMEENRIEDVRELMKQGIFVAAFLPRKVTDVPGILRRISTVLHGGQEADCLIAKVENSIKIAQKEYHKPIPCLSLIWKKPYMSFGPGTYIASILKMTGFENAIEKGSERYFNVNLWHVPGEKIKVLLLPTEPYPFTEKDLDEIGKLLEIPKRFSFIIKGELLTWYGAATSEALESMRQLYYYLSSINNRK